MARLTTHTEKSHLVSLICRINAAIRELECYLAEQRKLIRRREGVAVGLASTGRSRSAQKSARV